MDGTTSHIPQLLGGLGLCVPALAKKTPVKLVRVLISVGFQGQENLFGSFFLKTLRNAGQAAPVGSPQPCPLGGSSTPSSLLLPPPQLPAL